MIDKISGLLSREEREKLLAVITQYKDCFVWDNPKMSGLSRNLVEH